MFPPSKYPAYYQDLFDGSDVENLVQGILNTFDEPELTQVLYYKFDLDWDNKVAPGPFEDRVFALAKTLRKVGQLHWLVRLLDEKRPQYEVFVALRRKATPPLPANGAPPPGPAAGTGPARADGGADPWRLVMLHTDRPFLDRANFQEECRQVGLGNARPILSVAGGPDTGKSYSTDYLVGVTKALTTQRSIVIKEILLDQLKAVGTADIGGANLARRVSMAITDKPLPDYIARTFGSEQDTTWAADAADWIMSNAAEAPLRWLVLDGFETTVLSPSAQALIESLLAAVARDPKIRIALLGYLGNLSWCAPSVRPVRLDLEEFADREKLTLHVFEYLLEVQKTAAERGRPPFTGAQLVNEARQVLLQVDPSAPDLTALESALTGIAERVLVGS